MLFPQQNQIRLLTDLSGFWTFKPDKQDFGITENWFATGLPDETMRIAVPGAWNEQLAERGLFNFVGPGWYETELEMPVNLHTHRIVLRIGAADHHATVWLNGVPCGAHAIGYMPFETDLSDVWAKDKPNRLVIRVDNRLTMHTIPQDVNATTPPYDTPAYERRHLFPTTRFDFFPYGGITRAVNLMVIPKNHITDIKINSKLDGTVTVKVKQTGDLPCTVTIADGADVVASATMKHGSATLNIDTVRPWSPSDPHLYTLRAELTDQSAVVDQYNERFGIREVEVKNGQIRLNGEPLYLTGFGKHEEFPIVGRGQFRAAYLRDFELMRWTGANSFRTSHYPYDEEIMRLADELGFLVIDEVPAVSLGFWSDEYDDLIPLLENHKKSIEALIDRDYNHPSVISWSVTNEPNLWSEPQYQNEASRKYFGEIYAFTKKLDSDRPVMAITIPAFGKEDVALEACDVIGINRYYGWYTDPAELQKAAGKLDQELDDIYKLHQKPIVVTEFGADTIDGYHATYAQLFTEEFQTAFIKAYCDVIDSKPFCAGTHVWNFADFLTPQHFRRVVLNRKGVFTRVREPKAAAFWLRDHWRFLKRVHDKHRPAPSADGFLVPDV